LYWRILGVSQQNFTQLGGRADFLRPFIWSSASGLMRFCHGSDKGAAQSFIKVIQKCITLFFLRILKIS
jgi:hypothetical protein